MPLESDSRRIADDMAAAAAKATQANRRRMLLKGLGRGSAALAAVVPIKSFAVTSVTKNNLLCTISGVQSGVRSNTAVLPACSGKSVAFYTTPGTWPQNGTPVDVISNGASTFLRSTATFTGIFGGGSASTMGTLFGSVTDETHWIVALLNAQIPGNPNNFPYTPSQVVALYNSPQQAAAILFFKNNLE